MDLSAASCWKSVAHIASVAHRNKSRGVLRRQQLQDARRFLSAELNTGSARVNRVNIAFGLVAADMIARAIDGIVHRRLWE